MSHYLLLAQAQPPQTAIDMVVGGTLPTLIVLTVLAVFSLLSWGLIFRKWAQFRDVRRQGDHFLNRRVGFEAPPERKFHARRR